MSRRRPTGSRPRRTLRLPEHVRPETIELDLDLDPRASRFTGAGRYQLVLSRRCRMIELHSAELEVSEVRIEAAGLALAGSVEAHPECETIVLRFDRLLPTGPVQLELRFRGRVRSDLRGLYRSSDREAPWLASQLCPTDARRLFPCFDEPGIKARYALRVTAPADQVVVANAPIAREERLPEDSTRSRSRRSVPPRKRTTFETTPPLSAYLVAVAVGPFEVSRVARCGETPIRVVTLPGKQPLARFARRAAVASLERLERWFGMPHPYSKLDLVALPDFAFGAMENAGAVFFRDSVLLLDERDASAEERLRAAETIAHELAHMWFGNLVTMAWWNDLWLNESFATWMAYVIVDDWQPEWQIWLEFIQRREGALELDALTSSHPVAPPIRTAEEAHENFDAITYTKGAAVLRMLERFLGAGAFRSGVRRYIRRHREGVATAGDLWRALEDASALDVTSIVEPWISQTGYPLLRTTRTRQGRRQLEQARFLLARPVPRTRTTKPTRWPIPWLGRSGPRPAASSRVTSGRGRRRTTRHLLTTARASIVAPDGEGDWLYGNAFEAGFFRLDHGHESTALRDSVSALEPIERIGWLGHEWALARGRRAPVERTLELVDALRDETDPDVLSAIERVLRALAARPPGHDRRATGEALGDWIAARFAPRLDAIGIQPRRGETERERSSRARLIAIAAGLGGSPGWGEACSGLAESHLASGRPLPGETAAVILQVAAQRGNATLHRGLRRSVADATTPQARRRALFALTGFEAPPLLARTLRASLDRRVAPVVDRATLLMGLLAGARTAQPTWSHLQARWESLEREMPPILLARVAGETSRALEPDRAPEIERFFARHPLAAGGRTVEQVLEALRIARRFDAHAGRDLRRFLERPG